MKIISILFTVLLSQLTFSQTKSYYFSKAVPGKEVVQVAAPYFGTYEDGKGRNFVFSDSGLVILSTTVSAISRETIRESSQYRVEDGYLFGVVQGDSIPCVQDDENYLFGIRNRDWIIFKSSKNKLVLSESSTNTYYLQLAEGGVYSLMRLQFIKGELHISNFDYEVETTLFDSIEDQRSVNQTGVELVILNPNSVEFSDLLEQGIFDSPKVYKKAK